MIPTTIPHGRTARRLEWPLLPPAVRSLVAGRCGSPVDAAASQRAGFTPGLASVLTCQDGSRHFLKAASVKAQRPFATSYREEGRVLAALPEGTPAPRLLWSHDDEDWVLLGIEHVASRAPLRPWQPGDLAATLDALEECAERLTPAPAGLAAPTVADALAAFPGCWDGVDDDLGLPGLAEHRGEAAALAARFAQACAGRTLAHTDLRDDNVLITEAGRALVVDWAFPAVGAAWLDTVIALIGPRGDGLDVEEVLSTRRLTRDVPAEHVDILLALLAGYFLQQATQPAPRTSPYTRASQRWQGEVTWDWLCERRAWA